MATRTKPLMKSAVALASAAAIAVASPALAPSISAPTTNALSKAAYELTTFSDVFSIPPEELVGILFYQQSWGFTVGPGAVDFAVEPYDTMCSFQCSSTGISGATYLILDALINGTGNGWTPVYDAEGNPVSGGYLDWGISGVNYLFEPSYNDTLGTGSIFGVQEVFAGFSALADYILSATVGQALPATQPLIEAIFYGEDNVTRIWRAGWALAAVALEGLPFIGLPIANSIFAYLGALPAPNYPTSGAFYQEGLSGILQFWTNVFNGSQNPAEPYPPFQPPAAQAAAARSVARGPAAALAAATPTAAKATESAVATVADTLAGTASDSTASDSTAAASTAPAAESAGSTVTAATESVATETSTTTETSTATGTTAVDATPADAVTTAAPATKPAAAPKTRRHPVRDAVSGAAKAVSSAVSGAAKAATGGAAAKADSAAGTN